MSSQSTAALEAEIHRLKLEVHSLKTQHGSEISVGNYLLTRLEQLGVTNMFGVPGDFNLGFLDLVEDHPTIDWVGNCNELNAAYAADGYARANNSIGVVLTTFGVGELSAINGIAGAFSEMVPVLNLVGVPSTSQQHSKPMLHHTLGDGRFDAYTMAAQQFTYSQASLKNKNNAAAEIDRVLIDCITKARPVYLSLPTDLVSANISTERLSIPLTRNPPPNDPQTESFVIDLIAKQFEVAEGDAVVLVDAKTKFPVYSTPMGKTVVDENFERYGGIYLGSISRPEIREKVESAKLVLSVGGLRSDFNTGNFSYHIPVKRTIELHSDSTKVQYAVFQGIGMKELIPKLTERLETHCVAASKLVVPKFLTPVPKEESKSITHNFFWPRVAEFFRPHDIIVTETGTANFGILDVPLPEKSVLISQILWGSIGWSVGSLLGASLVVKESGHGRSILFIGDGSLQLTVQELSVMLRVGVKPIIFVLNNSGYTIERFIHGKTRKYNDISNWNWTSLSKVFGDPDEKISNSYTVRTKAELSDLLDNTTFAHADKMQVVEVIMEKLDAPIALRLQAEASGKANAYDAPLNPAITHA
ncbi:putative pyruvate decarboxylase C13A11.06 [Termitomyces sp. T112]|nr:putative pyruvate decarboxylase C13A11.06 [Termitomyces sp. T112]